MALGAPVPWYGSGRATFVSRRSDNSPISEGFVQANKRPGLPEADVCYIAPRLGQNAAETKTWQALLEYLIGQAGDSGIQRLYACVPSQDNAVTVLASCGFVRYVRETLFRLQSPGNASFPPADTHVRPQREEDSWAFQRLTDQHTPPVVQRAEGAVAKNNEAIDHLVFQTWWQPEHIRGIVYEQDEEIVAAMRIHRGRASHWLHFVGDPTAPKITDALIAHSIQALQNSDRPIYCSVRPYQSALGPVLRDHAFEPITELSRFVKHNTIRTREPARNQARIMIETSLPGIISTDTNTTITSTKS